MRVIVNKCVSIISPFDWTEAMTSGRIEQSIRNWQNRRHSGLLYCSTIVFISGWDVQYEFVNSDKFFRVLSRAEQSFKKCSTFSTVWQEFDNLQKPELLVDQWLHSASVLNLPEIRRAWTDAITTLVGDAPAVFHKGWGDDSDKYSGWKYWRDSSGEESCLNFCSQKSTTFFLTRF